jgi:RimJ/RimL family protein N-acetyltransferase
MFNRSYWGHGYGTEALRAFLPMFFAHYCRREHEHYDYAVALTDTELVSSQNVLTKAGFTLRERREKDFENPVLGLRDTLVYRIERTSAP